MEQMVRRELHCVVERFARFCLLTFFFFLFFAHSILVHKKKKTASTTLQVGDYAEIRWRQRDFGRFVDEFLY
jgi:hypothetical protein